MIALTPKCYFSRDVDADNKETARKTGNKGVPHGAKIEMDMYRHKLHKGGEFKFKIRTLQQKRGVMKRLAYDRRGLNRNFYKFPLAKDGVTCSALRDEHGNYV